MKPQLTNKLKNMKKSARISFRVSKEERLQATQIYKTASYPGSESSFFRDIILGKIRHPYFENEAIDSNDESRSKKVEGPKEVQAHYLAVVIAALMLRIKLDPEYHKYRKAEPKMFQKLIDEIRGYKYDEKTQLKMPLDRRGRN